MTDQQIAETMLGHIEWLDEKTGACECPGKHLHTHKTKKRDTLVYFDYAPTIWCVHQSCKAVVDDANLRLRRACNGGNVEPRVITDEERKKMAERAARRKVEQGYRDWCHQHGETIFKKYAWDPVDAFHESPIMTEQPESDFVLFMSMFKPDDLVWIGQPEDSGKKSDAAHFKPASEWQKCGPTGNYTCASVFNPTCSRCNDDVARRPFMVVESDELSKEESCSLTKWLSTFMHLRCMLDTGGKSIHSWFDTPPAADYEKLKIILEALGCDVAMFKASQPVRIPGVMRDNGKWQHLIYFNNL